MQQQRCSNSMSAVSHSQNSWWWLSKSWAQIPGGRRGRPHHKLLKKTSSCPPIMLGSLNCCRAGIHHKQMNKVPATNWKKMVMCLKAATLAFCTVDNKTKQFTIFLTFPKSKGLKKKKSVASGQLQRGWKWQTVVPGQSMRVCLWQTFNHRQVNCETCR